MFGRKRENPAYRNGIVAKYLQVVAERADQLVEVIGERIVVIYYQYHNFFKIIILQFASQVIKYIVYIFSGQFLGEEGA